MASVYAASPILADVFPIVSGMSAPNLFMSTADQQEAGQEIRASEVIAPQAATSRAPRFMLDGLQDQKARSGLARAAHETPQAQATPVVPRHASIRHVRLATPVTHRPVLQPLARLMLPPPLPIALRRPDIARLRQLDERALEHQMMRFAATQVHVRWLRGAPSWQARLHPMHSTLFARHQIVSGDVALCLWLLGNEEDKLAARVLLNDPVRVMNQLRARVPCLCSLKNLEHALPLLVPLMVTRHAHSYREPAVAAALMVQAYLKLQGREEPKDLEVLLVELMGREFLGWCTTPAETGALLGTLVAGFFRYVRSLAERDEKRRVRLAAGVNILLSLNGLPFQTTATAIVATVVTVAVEALATSAGPSTAMAQLMAIKGDLKLHIAANGIAIGAAAKTVVLRSDQEREALLCNQTLDAVIDANGLS